MKREHFSSRLGFILITAACSIGLGNIWRFPYITGKYGGASFVIFYLIFLVILGLPLGSLVFLLFCTRRYGWGWDRFYKETSIGKGLPYPRFARNYISYILPVIVLVIFVSGYLSLMK